MPVSVSVLPDWSPLVVVLPLLFPVLLLIATVPPPEPPQLEPIAKNASTIIDAMQSQNLAAFIPL